MWTKDQYRWCFIDMHIGYTNDEYLSKLDPERIVKQIKGCGAQTMVVKCRPWSGYAYYPTEFGEMHPTLKKKELDYVKTMVELCRKEGIHVKAYFDQGFDNWAYENHPEWRSISPFGTQSLDVSMPVDGVHMRKSRYANVCINNPEYVEYCKNCLREMISKCHFDSIFLDMPFFPWYVCQCKACKDKYLRETGKEMPTAVDWDDPEFREFQYKREVWAGDFAMEMSRTVKETDPDCTCEHNLQSVLAPWTAAETDLTAEANDYCSADTYDSYFEQSFFCKYFKNLSKTLPYVFISGKCKQLSLHTTTKATDELARQGFIALLHNAAFSICDGMNPDGTLTDIVYADTIKNSFAKTKPYEEYVNGDLISNAAVWFPSHSKYDRDDNGKSIAEACMRFGGMKFYGAKVASGRLLNMLNIPYDTIPSKKLGYQKNDLLIIASVANIRDEEMKEIESYIMNGGSVYISGKPGHTRILELLEAEYVGDTEHFTTYMDPTESGKRFFKEFDRQQPAACGIQSRLSFKAGSEYETLAELVLPYTLPTTSEFAAIHSDPPGVYTGEPCAVLKNVGKGKILWVGGEMELADYYNGKIAVARMFKELSGELKYEACAPNQVEVMSWMKDGKQYVAAVNELDDMPAAPMCGVSVTLPYEAKKVTLLNSDKALDVTVGGGKTRIGFPVIELFEMAEIER